MKKIFYAVCLGAMLTLASCENYMARKGLGKMNIAVEPGYEVAEATWKADGDLWYLLVPMDSDYTPKTKIFKAKSMYGVLEGEVKFIESR